MTFELEPAVPADAAAVAELVQAVEAALYGHTTFAVGDLEDEWSELDPADDVRLVRDGDRVVGYSLVRERGEGWEVEGVVHPDACGRGIGRLLATRLEAAAAEGGARTVHNSIIEIDLPARALLESLGYTAVRVFREMRIALDAPPAAPDWPDGLTAGAFDRERDAVAFHAAHQEAFRDHWDYTPRDFAAWTKSFLDTERFVPALWCVVRDGDEIAAGTISTPDTYGGGFVHAVFTRRPWRRRGLGAALLHDAFRRLYDHGEREVGLGVDAASATGAFRLYERAGMTPALGWTVYEKRL